MTQTTTSPNAFPVNAIANKADLEKGFEAALEFARSTGTRPSSLITVIREKMLGRAYERLAEAVVLLKFTHERDEQENWLETPAVRATLTDAIQQTATVMNQVGEERSTNPVQSIEDFIKTLEAATGRKVEVINLNEPVPAPVGTV